MSELISSPIITAIEQGANGIPTRIDHTIPQSWSGNIEATQAAQAAIDAGGSMNDAFDAALKAAMDNPDAVIDTVASDDSIPVRGAGPDDSEEDLDRERHEYFISICNVMRGVADLDFESARKAAATCKFPFVGFNEWKKRID